MSATIKVQNLSKTYRVHEKEPGIKGSLKALIKRKHKQVEAVKDISFLIEERELVGFIGPNGAGKTTTLKMLSGLLYPTSGKIRVLGFDPWKRQYNFLNQIALVMGRKNQLWWDLPAIESFKLYKEIYGLERDKYKKTLNFLVDILDLQDLLNTQVRKLSLGQRMKAELVAALLHRPKVLFLDEPTIGLDVVMQKNLRNFIKDYQEKFSASIILTSHYMDDVKELAKRVIIINKGEILFDGPLKDIVLKYAKNKEIELVFDNSVDPKSLQQYGKIKSFQDNSATLSIPRDKVPAISSKILSDHNVIDINIKEQEIKDIISAIFQKL